MLNRMGCSQITGKSIYYSCYIYYSNRFALANSILIRQNRIEKILSETCYKHSCEKCFLWTNDDMCLAFSIQNIWKNH